MNVAQLIEKLKKCEGHAKITIEVTDDDGQSIFVDADEIHEYPNQVFIS